MKNADTNTPLISEHVNIQSFSPAFGQISAQRFCTTSAFFWRPSQKR